MSIFDDFVGFIEDLGGQVGGTFVNFGNIVANGSANLAGTIGNGVIGIYQDAAGGIAYALDATKATANDVGAWTEGAAGSVANFSVDAYSTAKKGVEDAWQTLSTFGMEPMPELGPPDPAARSCMKYLLGGSEAAVAGWESNARALGYTMAWNVGCSVQMVGSASAFSGVYLDRGGSWGFFRGSETAGPAVALPSAEVQFELWMVFGDKDRYGGECRKLGLNIELPFALGLNASFGGHVLLTSGFDFLGFHVKAGGGMGVSVPDNVELASSLAEKSGGYDAAVRAVRSPSSEPKVIAAAALSTLPFVRSPNSQVFIQVKGSRRFYDVAFASSDARNEVIATGLTCYDNQQFAFKDNGDGSYIIDPVQSRVVGGVFDIAGSSGDNGARLIQFGQHGANNQRFQVMSADNGWYYLLNKNSGKVLSCENAALTDRVNIVQRAWDHGQDQMVRFFTSSELPAVNHYYVLTNVATNQQLGCAAAGLTANQGPGEAWKIESSTSGALCLRGANDQYLSTNATSPVMAAAQTADWHLVPTSDGLFSLEREGRNVIASGSTLTLSCQEYSVPAKMATYDWTATGRTWLLPETGRGMVSFTADCAVDDVYVFIASSPEDTSPGYVITIGGWNNTKTLIRRGINGPVLGEALVGLTARGGQNPLWVSIDSETGRIEVGRGLPGRDCFISVKDPSFVVGARHVTFSSWSMPIQYSQVTVLPIAASSVAIPERQGAYRWSPSGKVFALPEAGRGTVAFTANGDSDVYAAISTQDGDGGSLYEIVIGAANNDHSVIRRAAQGTPVASVQGGLKAPGKPNPLWISVDKNTGWIKVGRGLPGQDVFLSYQDPAFFSGVRHVTFSSWNRPIDYSQISTLAIGAALPPPTLGAGLWRIAEVLSVPAENAAYNGSRPSWKLLGGRGVFSFTIDQNDAYVLIGPTAGSKSGAYEITLGGWNNTKSILRSPSGQVIATAMVGLLALGGRNAFWVSIDDRTGIIQVGRNAPGQDVFLFAIDPALRSAAPVSERIVSLSAWGQPIFFSQLQVAPITSSVSMSLPAGPGVDHAVWMANLPISGSARWVAGCAVRYAVAFELASGLELRGPWWSIAGSDANGYYKPSYACPTLINISVEPSGKAVARRIYRQFQGEASESLIGRIPNNVSVSFGDGDTALVPRWSRVNIGDQGVTGVKRSGIALPSGFTQAPAVVLVTPFGENYNDTFTMSTSVVGPQSATNNTFRMDYASNWGQNLGASLLASETITRQNFQAGSTSLGTSGTLNVRKTVAFPQAFAQAPRVIATARGENYADTFAVTVVSVSSTGFQVNIQRVDGGAGWGQTLRLDWIAFRDEGLGDFPASAVASGTATIGSGPTTVKRVPVNFNRTFSTIPTVMLTAAHTDPYSDTFAVTATNVTTTGFTANVKRADYPANGWGLNLLLHWLALV